MAKLAILGHATRGKEVIESLEMLGGKNDNHCYGSFISRICFINKYGYIESCDRMHHLDYLQLTLEEFLEKFPHKVGDKVLINDDENDVYTVKSMVWDEDLNQVTYRIEAVDGIMDNHTWFAHEMMFFSPKKEEIEGKITINEDKGTLVAIDLTQDIKKANEIEVILGDYEFMLKDGKTYFVKKNKHPKTYEECCKVLCYKPIVDFFAGLYDDEENLYGYFISLKRCRDAYWKIAGKQMGLGKPWEPDWLDTNTQKYCIYYVGNEIKKQPMLEVHHFLAFPTTEMRDAFFENFKTLIEECRELL